METEKTEKASPPEATSDSTSESTPKPTSKCTAKCTPKPIPIASSICSSPQEILLAATTITIAITKGRSVEEIETLINLLSLVNDNLRSTLTQMVINRKLNINYDINI